MIEVITFQDWRKENFPKDQVIVTVSKSTTWSQGLSPFILGPCKLYEDYESKNMENAWQFTKVYTEHATMDGDIHTSYWEWAKNGWASDIAFRYPMGKGRKPLFSLWKVNGEFKKLDYIEARKRIYIPLYYHAVKNTEAFEKLKQKYEQLNKDGKDLYLVDFDAYRHKIMHKSYSDVINNPARKMGHAFVLAMMLEEPEKLELAIKKYA